jgi:lipid II:glycine glycyltransferase (peptidoglycan interpeptide bridge formation enzyme)
MLRINVAYHDDTPLGADLILLYRGAVFDWYRGLQRVKSLYPGECLVWHQMEWAKEQGFTIYDFAGAGYPNLPYGVREFKAKFGGTQVNYGRYRRVYAPLRLALAERVYEWRRARAESRGPSNHIEAGKDNEP